MQRSDATLNVLNAKLSCCNKLAAAHPNAATDLRRLYQDGFPLPATECFGCLSSGCGRLAC